MIVSRAVASYCLGLLLWACAGVAQAAAPVLLDQVLDGLAQHSAVRARFTQTRENPALATPQVSTGKLLFVNGNGMLWQVESPYDETLAFTSRHSGRVTPEGRVQSQRNQRGIAEVSRMLQSLLAGHTTEVTRQFDIAAEGDAAAWLLRFTPQQERMARVLAAIELTGNKDYLQSIHIRLQDGSNTDIRLHDTRDADALSALERRALGMP